MSQDQFNNEACLRNIQKKFNVRLDGSFKCLQNLLTSQDTQDIKVNLMSRKEQKDLEAYIKFENLLNKIANIQINFNKSISADDYVALHK